MSSKNRLGHDLGDKVQKALGIRAKIRKLEGEITGLKSRLKELKKDPHVSNVLGGIDKLQEKRDKSKEGAAGKGNDEDGEEDEDDDDEVEERSGREISDSSTITTRSEPVGGAKRRLQIRMDRKLDRLAEKEKSKDDLQPTKKSKK